MSVHGHYWAGRQSPFPKSCSAACVRVRARVRASVRTRVRDYKDGLGRLSAKPLSRAQIAEALGHEAVSGTVNRAIKELFTKRLIEYTLPEKPRVAFKSIG